MLASLFVRKQVRDKGDNMSKNANLRSARDTKNDEFYTQISDIEKELKHYKKHFKDAIVFCNCDDPDWSNFWKYFHLNFEYLGLKKLITTHYNASDPTYKMEYEGGNDSDTSVGVITPLKQNGDFRSPECLELMDEATIICTNPPFSLFIEYVKTLVEHNKKFLVIGNKNAIANSEFFPFLKNGDIWIGVNNVKEFGTPSGTMKKFGNIGWYTNLDIVKRHEELSLWRKYNPSEYPTYNNYNAINVNKVSDIPVNFYGIMGVPISFMDVHNPDQFEIIALGATGNSDALFEPTIRYTGLLRYNTDGTTTKAHIACNQCLTLGFDEKPDGIYCRADNTDKYLVVPYRRVLIRRRKK